MVASSNNRGDVNVYLIRKSTYKRTFDNHVYLTDKKRENKRLKGLLLPCGNSNENPLNFFDGQSER